MSKKARKQKTQHGLPVVQVTVPRGNADEMRELMRMFGGARVGSTDFEAMAVAYDRDISNAVKRQLHRCLSRARCECRVASGDVQSPTVTITGVFQPSDRLVVRSDGETFTQSLEQPLPLLQHVVDMLWWQSAA